jgi:hypothetical protein
METNNEFKMRFKNKKTGKIFFKLHSGLDVTTSRVGTMVVIYQPDNYEKTIFVMEEKEFYEKFELLDLE